MTDFTMTQDAQGIATLTWNCIGKSMNVMSFEALQQMNAMIDQALADEAVKGIILTSGKKDFAAGMDLNVLADLRNAPGDNPAEGVFKGIQSIHQIFRKIERAGMDLSLIHI